jgi:hypothetical protein
MSASSAKELRSCLVFSRMFSRGMLGQKRPMEGARAVIPLVVELAMHRAVSRQGSGVRSEPAAQDRGIPGIPQTYYAPNHPESGP